MYKIKKIIIWKSFNFIKRNGLYVGVFYSKNGFLRICREKGNDILWFDL